MLIQLCHKKSTFKVYLLLKEICTKGSIIDIVFILCHQTFKHPYFFQNYLNESLKYLDKSYPNSSSLTGLPHSPPSSMADTKPIYIDTKALLGHHHPMDHKK